MGKSLSLDIRERVVSLVEDGHSCHEAVRRFQISAASAVRIMQRKRCFGSLVAAVQGRPRTSKLDAVSDFLTSQIEATPDKTMPELAAELFGEHGIRATPAMLSRHLIHRLGYTYKKIPDCNGAPPEKGARYEWRHFRQPRMRLEPHRLIFIPSRQIALQSPVRRWMKLQSPPK